MKLFELLSPIVAHKSGASTQFTCLDVIKSICGAQNITMDKNSAHENMILVVTDTENDPTYTPKGAGWSIGGEQFPGYAAEIRIPNPAARDAKSIAFAAHEACHAWMAMRSKGHVFNNEKLTNAAAEKWLRTHLSGMELRAALDFILHSRISYGDNTPSFVKPKLPG